MTKEYNGLEKNFQRVIGSLGIADEVIDVMVNTSREFKRIEQLVQEKGPVVPSEYEGQWDRAMNQPFRNSSKECPPELKVLKEYLIEQWRKDND